MVLSSDVVKVLSDIYYNPDHPASFGSIDDVYKSAHGVTRKQVKEYLQSQDTYSRHAYVKKTFKRNPIWTSGPYDTWFADLHSTENIQGQNRRKRFLLVVIDAFSHYIYCRALKNKTGLVVFEAFKDIIKQAGDVPIKLVTDSGSEFLNRQFQQYLSENNIKFIAARPPLKASQAELAGKLLKKKIWRFMTANKTKSFIDHLQQFVNSLNGRKMASLNGLAPKDITPENQTAVYFKKFAKFRNKKNTDFKFALGSKVRLVKTKESFTKSYWPGFSGEVYIIDGLIPHFPREKYRLKDLVGNQIKGTFYSEELTQVL